METKTAACYIRVSTDKQEELSPDSQLKEIKKYAAANGYILLPEFIFMEEEGVSGKRADNRHEFQRMIATAKQKPKPFDVLLLWKFSRFARNQDEASFYKGILRKKCGIDIVSISEPVMEGMYGRLIEMIIEWSDEFYSYNLSGEVMRGMSEKAIRGGYQSGVPFGYVYDKSMSVPAIDPDAADVIKKIFNMFTEEGCNCFDIARRLNSLGIRTRKGKNFEMRTVRYILENPFYTGKIRWNRQHHESHSIKDPSEWIISVGKHEPIISQQQFDDTQELLVIRKRNQKVRPASSKKHWLSGIVKCGNCGYSLFVGGKTTAGNTSFQCGNYLKGKCSISHSVIDKKIEDAIIQGLNDLCSSSTVINYKTLPRASSNNLEMSLLSISMKKLESKEQRIKEAYMNGVDSLEEYKSNKQLLLAERSELESKIASITTKDKKVIPYKQELRNVLDVIVGSDNFEKKSDALRSVVNKITYYKKDDRFEFDLIRYQ